MVIAAIAGYLLGSLPFGWLVARVRGVDIFAVGSGSSGATNVRRAIGRRAAYLVFALDVLKGSAAVGCMALFPGPVSPMIPVLSLFAALVGHRFSCFTGFRGGKGVATAAGGFLVLAPAAVLIAAGVWIVVFLAARYVSLASILAALALPAAAYLLNQPPSLVACGALVAAFIIASHRTNVVRLLTGTEARFSRAKEEPR